MNKLINILSLCQNSVSKRLYLHWATYIGGSYTVFNHYICMFSVKIAHVCTYYTTYVFICKLSKNYPSSTKILF